MKLNTDKCHFLVLGRKSNQQVTVNVGDSAIENAEEEKLLRVVVDKNSILRHMSVSCVKRLVTNSSPSLTYLNTWILIK